MQIIRHRRNTIEELKATPEKYGIELDLRSFGNKIIIHHDPFVDAQDFEEWIKFYKHKTLILNVKEEGLETRLLEIMKKHNIEDFFFLDQSFPFLIKTAKQGEKRCAVRVSEFESVQTALALAGRIKWVWVDCFVQFPLTKSSYSALKAAGFKLCLVSPELQGRTDPKEIADMKELMQKEGMLIDAVCTKTPELWEAK